MIFRGPSGNVSVLYLGDSDVARWPLETAYGKDGSPGCNCDDVTKRWKPTSHKWVTLICGENDMLQTYLDENPKERKEHPLGSNNGNYDVGDQTTALSARPVQKPAGKGHETKIAASSKDPGGVDKAFGRFAHLAGLIIKSGSRVLYMGTKPESAIPPALHANFRKYDARIMNYAAKLAGAVTHDRTPPMVVIDTHGSILDLGNPRDFYYDDGMHLSNKGYFYFSKWSNQVLSLGNSTCIVWRSGKCVRKI